jgi:hypothetical protein
MKPNLFAWGTAFAGCLPLLAFAQAAKTELPSAVPQLTYRSAFTGYKPYRDAPLANWREVNAILAGAPGGASGHAGHGTRGFEDIEMPATPAASASGPMQMKAIPNHDGHSMQGGKP